MVVIGIENTHDSGATAIIDGKIVYSVNEERLNRVKGFGGFPYKSLEAILKKIGNVKIDAIALDGITKLGSPGDFERPDRLRIFREGAAILGIDKMLTYSNYRVETLFSILKIILPNKINIELNEFNLGATKVIREDHHTCHAASAFYASGWDECLVLTMDGSGDGYSSRVFVAENRKLKLVHSIPMVHSLCANYSYATSVLGFKTNRHEGKLLGLAAYTETNKECLRIFQDRISYDKNIMSFKNRGMWGWPERNRLKELLKNFSREEIANAVQVNTEDLVIKYVKDMLKKYGKSKIALGGGLFANVKINQRISELDEVEEIFIFPNMGDGGNHVGAAYYVYENYFQQKVEPLKTVYYGNEYSDKDIKFSIIKHRLNYRWFDNPEKKIAELLHQGKIVARFNGAMELGPRALGNRSILYHARDASVNQWLNDRLERNEFMPFAPVMMEEEASRFLVNYGQGNRKAMRYMTMTDNVTDAFREIAPAATHIDNTARPQVVGKEDNPSLFKLLSEYKKLSGHGIIINTSFNIHEEPIVCSPDDAIIAFLRAGLDVLSMGNFIVMKENLNEY